MEVQLYLGSGCSSYLHASAALHAGTDLQLLIAKQTVEMCNSLALLTTEARQIYDM